MFTQKFFLVLMLIVLVLTTRIKNGLRFKDLQEKLTVDELESIKYMVQFGKINNIVDLIKKKEGNLTISELAEIKGVKKPEERYNMTLLSENLERTIKEVMKQITNNINEIKQEVNELKKEYLKHQIEKVGKDLVHSKKGKQMKQKIHKSPLIRLSEDLSSMEHN